MTTDTRTERAKRFFYREIERRVTYGFGERPPAWMGFAWMAYDRDCTVYMPIPLNWIARWARGAWLFLRYPNPSEWDMRFGNALVRARSAGFDLGFAQGRADGIERGRVQFADEIRAEMLVRNLP